MRSVSLEAQLVDPPAAETRRLELVFSDSPDGSQPLATGFGEADFSRRRVDLDRDRLHQSDHCPEEDLEVQHRALVLNVGTVDDDLVRQQRALVPRLEVFAGDPPAPDDPSLTVRPENLRAWENNQTYHTLRF